MPRSLVLVLVLGLSACADEVPLVGEDIGSEGPVEDAASDAGRVYPDVCFVGETAIAAADRSVSIAALEVGDLVWSRDVETGRDMLRPIARIIEKSATELFAIHTEDGVIDGVTGSHPLWVVDRAGYVKVARLRVGQRLWSERGRRAEWATAAVTSF